MDRELYAKFAAVEHKHWWFTGRRLIVKDFLKRLKLQPYAKILEAGCGTGGNLEMLAEFGRVYAIEPDEIAVNYAASYGVAAVKQGSLPEQIPFLDQEYDLIVMLDVLEHLDQDERALQQLFSRLKVGGWILITVPAFQFLWSYHDELNHHKRRYRLGNLKKLVRKSGYQIKYASYFNFFLFPIALMVRLLGNFASDKKRNTSIDLKLPPQAINKILETIFSSERLLLNRTSLPFGVSILILAQKP